MADRRRVLLVGGTGVLAPALHALTAAGTPSVVVSRHAERVSAVVDRLVRGQDLVEPCVVDVTNRLAWSRAVEHLVETGGVTEAVAYMPFAGADAWAQLARCVTGTLVPVLTSSAADPSGASRAFVAGCWPASTRVLLLGWHGSGRGHTRWHTPEEISVAALSVLAGDGGPAPATGSAIAAADSVLILGRVRPWCDRPER